MNYLMVVNVSAERSHVSVKNTYDNIYNLLAVYCMAKHLPKSFICVCLKSPHGGMTVVLDD